MLSPVWTPIGSMFSILQMVTQLLAASRITSYSISFQPISDFSSRTWLMGLAASPPDTMARNSSSVWAMPPPVPPSVYAGRTTRGSPRSGSAAYASSMDSTMALGGTGSPMLVSRSRKSSRSSALRMVCSGVPSRRAP